MNALSEVHELRRRRIRDAGPEPDRPIGARPVLWVDGEPQVEPPAQGRVRADVWWAEVARAEKAGTLTNRTLAQAHFADLMVEDDPVRLRRAAIRAAAMLTEMADLLDPARATSAPVVPAQR
jgi:hypothetical protein